MKVIVVNNPAAKNGGALTILKDFLKKTKNLKCSNRFYVFTCLEELKKYETEKLKVIVIEKQGFINRIYWDNYGLKKNLRINNIFPDLFISLQNTGVNIDKEVPQIIYYHQLLSIVDLKWNPFDKEERIFWLYKNIYPFFVKQYLSRVKKVIVQTDCVKEMFLKKFDFKPENIKLIRPKVKQIDIKKIKDIPKEKIRIFYPAAPLIYKNHIIIIEALEKLKEEFPELEKKMECVFTFSSQDNANLYQIIKDKKIENIVKLVGTLSYEQVLEYYKSSDLLVFPSYLETFGLPLLEAQNFEIKILTVDLPYSREAAGEYSNIRFIDKTNFIEWKEEIKKAYIEIIGRVSNF